MDDERYKYLEVTGAPITDKEIQEGWHYCYEWDGMLINKSWPEAECCKCFEDKDYNA